MIPRGIRTLASGALSVALTCILAVTAAAQTSTGTVRGMVRSGGAAAERAEVTARNLASGLARTVSTRADGSYVLPGLDPGNYDLSVRMIGATPQTQRIRVAIGATIVVDFDLQAQAVQLQELAVTGARPVVETQTSEVATNVTQEQITKLPSPDRNFLDLSVLAPGVVLQGDRINSTRKTFATGAQSAEQINVFIDGVSQKNDILLGGVVGQDASRGNPFPRNAIQEYRVITQNYKAEYEKASSGIITATTKSGSNVWEGTAFVGYVAKGLVALDSFQIAAKNDNPDTFRKPDYSRTQLGLSVGGPLIQDKLHLFVSYEGNYQNRTSQVTITPPPASPNLTGFNFSQYNGTFDSPFRETLVFGKLTYDPTANSSFEASYSLRTEYDIRDFGGFTAYSAATKFNDDVNTANLQHKYFKGPWLNEASASFQNYHYNPVPNDQGNGINQLFGFGCCAQIGANVSEQDFTQKRLSLRDVLTYTGIQGHVFKGGVYTNFLKYDVIKRNSENPRFVYEPWFNDFAIPERVEFQAGDPNFSTNNTQLGVFLQDDWSPIERLTLNLGVRWDYETHMLNYDYVTPRPIVDSLTKYADRLFIPIDPNRYFTDGTQRSRYAGMIQPRLGLSYGIDRAGKTTLYAGWGLFYDRTLFDQTIEEKFALQHPSYTIHFRPAGDTDPARIDWDPTYLNNGQQAVSRLLSNAQAAQPEVKLLPNDLRPPKAQQFSVGIRQLIGDWAVQAAYTGVRSKNVFTFYWANQNFTCPERSFGVPGCFVNNQVPGYSTILVADNAGKTWYDALQVQIDRPYQRTAANLGWGAGAAITVAKRQTEGFNDNFSFPNPVDYPKQVRNDERFRVVAHGIVDLPWVWGIQAGALVTYGSGLKYDVGDRFGGTTNPLDPGGFRGKAFKNVDLRVRKDFPDVAGTRIGVTADLFNAFNNQNLGCYNTFNPSDAAFGNAGCVISDPRRFQIGVEYLF